tara:strand:- start:44 stop:580 length:537 start_codon:yes stop_codon:yes gene_type:complete
MSTLKLTGSSSGSTSLNAPASGSNRTITFPDTAGTVALAGEAKILQIVTASDAQKDVTSSTYADIYDSDISITLASTSNKVFILHVTPYAYLARSGSGDIEAVYRLKRTTSGDTVANLNLGKQRLQSGTDINGSMVLSSLDSSFSNLTNTYNVELSYGSGDEQATAYNNNIYLFEVSA